MLLAPQVAENCDCTRYANAHHLGLSTNTRVGYADSDGMRTLCSSHLEWWKWIYCWWFGIWRSPAEVGAFSHEKKQGFIYLWCCRIWWINGKSESTKIQRAWSYFPKYLTIHVGKRLCHCWWFRNLASFPGNFGDGLRKYLMFHVK